MESRGRAAITFTLNGRRYDLSREAVATELLGVAPEAIRKHAVRVNNIWFPVIQAFESATGIPRSDFISQTARRHLAALGYEVSGATQPHGNTMPSPETSAGPPTHSNRPEVGPAPPVEEWHTEANVQASLVTALAADGWRILSVANTATKEHGIDVIASRNRLVIGWRPHGSELCRWRTAARSARQRTDPAEGSACGLRSACRSRSGHPPSDDLVLVTA